MVFAFDEFEGRQTRVGGRREARAVAEDVDDCARVLRARVECVGDGRERVDADGELLAGLAREEELVPFGGEQAHKAFALAVGLHLFVDALTPDDGFGAVLLVARPEADPVPALRELAAGARLPGDRR